MKQHTPLRRSVALTALALALFLTTGTAQAGKISAFSADQVITDAKGATVNQGKVYMRPDRMRMDVHMPESQGAMVMIFRKDLDRHWMLNPTAKTYYEDRFKEDELKKLMQDMDHNQDETILGTETVSGFPCTKKQVRTTVTVMGFTNTATTTLWISDKFDMPLRSRSQDGVVTELRNILQKAPADRHFELPDGYRKVDSMIGLFMTGEDAEMDADQSDMPEDGGMPPFSLPKGFKLPFGDN